MKKRSPEERRETYLRNKEKVLEKCHTYYQTHKKEISERSRIYRQTHKEEERRRMRKHYLAHRKERGEYQVKNKERRHQWVKGYIKNRKEKDIGFKLGLLLRSRIYNALKRNQRNGSAIRDLGCSLAELKFYIEGQFKDGMSWENWSLKGWHLDHKIPLTYFDLTDREQFLQAVHYTNLQPLWAKDNIAKGGANRLKDGIRTARITYA